MSVNNFFSSVQKQYSDLTQDLGLKIANVADQTYSQSLVLVDFAKMVIADSRLVAYLMGVDKPEGLIKGFEQFTAFVYFARAPFQTAQNLAKYGWPFITPRYQEDSLIHKKGDIDYAALFMLFGSYFETADYLKKANVTNFALFSSLSNTVGSIELLKTSDTSYTVSKMPEIDLLINAPKLFFYLLGSIISLKNWAQELITATKDQRKDYHLLSAQRITAEFAIFGRAVKFGLFPYLKLATPFVLWFEAAVTLSKYTCDIIKIEKKRNEIKKKLAFIDGSNA